MTDVAPPRILAIDTATRSIAVAVGRSADAVDGVDMREARHRHGSTLLEQVDAALDAASLTLDDIEAIAVGTGPGSFTGMRVGLATAKTISYVRSLPIVGVPSAAALRGAVERHDRTMAGAAVVLPAGAHDHYLALPEAPVRMVPPGELVAALDERPAISIDMPADVLGDAAAARGEMALSGLAVELLALAAARLAAGDRDDVEELVPAYVALPRGVGRGAEDLGWSPDLQ